MNQVFLSGEVVEIEGAHYIVIKTDDVEVLCKSKTYYSVVPGDFIEINGYAIRNSLAGNIVIIEKLVKK